MSGQARRDVRTLARAAGLTLLGGLMLALLGPGRAQADALGEVDSQASWRIVEVRDDQDNVLPDFPAGFSLVVSDPPPPLTRLAFEERGAGTVSFGGMSSATNAGINSTLSLTSNPSCLAPPNGVADGAEDAFNTIVVDNESGQAVTVVMEFTAVAVSLLATRQDARESAEVSVDIAWPIPWPAAADDCPPPWSFTAPAGPISGLVSLFASVDTAAGDAGVLLSGTCVIRVTVPPDDPPGAGSSGALFGNLAFCRAVTPIFLDGFENTQ